MSRVEGQRLVNAPATLRTVLLISVVSLCAPVPVLTGQDLMSRAFDMERRGSYPQAAEIYKSVLKDRPADLQALLGLERSLTPVNRLVELLPSVQAALAANPSAAPVYAVAMRAYAAANMLDSLPPLVDMWSRMAPGDETPYREWAAAALQRRDRPTARRAYQLGRERLGHPDALAPEIAQLAVLDEDWPAAVREWAKAVRQLPGYRASATSTLGQAPERAHGDILKSLEKESGTEIARIAVDLRARWGDPEGAFQSLLEALPSGPSQQLDILQTFLEESRLGTTPSYLLTQGRVLEAIADRSTSPGPKARFRLESARAYASGGDRPAARRMLTQIVTDQSSGPAVAAGATTTLIGLLVDEGKVDEASAQLERYRTSMPVDDYLRLRRAIAARWGRGGDLKRAEALLVGDSTVEALALMGRFRLYAGDLKGVSDLWKEAGPFAGTRGEATERSVILALIQPVKPDTLVPLGQAFQLLDGGDSLAAAQRFELVGRQLPADGGRAELTLFAGRIYAEIGHKEAAEAALRASVLTEAPNTAAAALLELGRLLIGQKREAEASQALEKMILGYPTSALVPQARRLLDQVHGAVPQT